MTVTVELDRYVPPSTRGMEGQIAMGATDARRQPDDGDRRRSDLTNRLLVQVPAAQADDFWSVGDQGGGGIVVSGARALFAAFGRAREMPAQPVLVDRRRYSGGNRASGTARFDPSWIEQQRDLRTAVVLTDSGYVGQGDQKALTSILEQAGRAGDDVCAVLPLHLSWLADRRVELLIGELNQHEVPAALVLEHRKDPLATQYAVNGLKHLLDEAQVPVSLLSTDISGVGAMAHGAAWAAVGITSALRHLYPAGNAGPPFPPPPARYAIVPKLMTFMNVERIAEGWARAQCNEDLIEDLWRCDCVECGYRTMDRFVTCTGLSLAAHNIGVLDDLHQKVTGPASWERAIKDALDIYGLMQDEYRLTWRPPEFMNAWLPRFRR
ncbi:hypothetical protein J5X84_38185 [Streptosporangiaceae bacterium NEAU-GS5]|nr:hypothetical protein [Streptosporangiaceae bacterium NEAU-GS5]